MIFTGIQTLIRCWPTLESPVGRPTTLNQKTRPTLLHGTSYIVSLHLCVCESVFVREWESVCVCVCVRHWLQFVVAQVYSSNFHKSCSRPVFHLFPITFRHWCIYPCMKSSSESYKILSGFVFSLFKGLHFSSHIACWVWDRWRDESVRLQF